MKKVVILSLFLLLSLSVLVSAYNCVDSDGGLNYNTIGEVSIDGNCPSSGIGCKDSCLLYSSDSNEISYVNSCSGSLCKLEEHACNSEGQQIVPQYNCPNGCENGACIQKIDGGSISVPTQSTQTCTDSDGLNYYTIGEVVIDPYFDGTRFIIKDNCGTREYLGYVLEATCNLNDNGDTYVPSNYKCPNGCSNGACIQQISGGTTQAPVEPNQVGTATTEPTPVASATQEPIEYKDAVKCIFKDSTAIQKCYSADDKGYTCSGQETCVIPVTEGELGSTITWKSSCGGYAYTTIDNDNDYAEFYCGDQNQIEIKTYQTASWTCTDDNEDKTKESETCKSNEVWEQYARSTCTHRCAEGEKCLNDQRIENLKLSNECASTIIVHPTEQPISVTIPSSPSSIVSCNGCLKDDKCYPMGYRKSGEYCTDSYSFVIQSQENAKCDNSFECESNVCVSGKCVSSSLIQKIISWFSNLFG